MNTENLDWISEAYSQQPGTWRVYQGDNPKEDQIVRFIYKRNPNIEDRVIGVNNKGEPLVSLIAKACNFGYKIQ